MSGDPRPLHRIFKKLRTVGLAAAALVAGAGARDGAQASTPALQLVATWPVEVDEPAPPDLPAAHTVWVDMIDGATTHIDLAHFYASNREGSRLEPVIVALERAATRGVTVRWLAEDSFHVTYPETLDRLDAVEGIEVRRLRTRELLGGPLHTKLMLVDGREAFVGSQNFDWRALEHIVELGVRIAEPKTVGVYEAVFDTDWQLAAGTDVASLNNEWDVDTSVFPRTVEHTGAPVEITPVLGGPELLPDRTLWDLPHLVDAIDSATERVRAQMLTYSPLTRDGEFWPDLDNALRGAAARGLRVELLVSHWNTRPGQIEHLQSLQSVPGIEVRVATVPEWSGGFVPYARVLHAKTLSVDGRIAWVGTSNWSHGYFHGGRHHGLMVEGASFAREIDTFFERVWTAPWSETVAPGRNYPEPRVDE